uniref:Capsid protein n=1 Tax=Peanut stunt virus TaxID=12313 RepID=A0A2H4LH98_9BROM|nr:coat protein [Peanut stunt virus]
MASRSGNGSRKSRKGKRSPAVHADAHARELRALTAQLNRWVFYHAAQMPTLEHPTFVYSRKCRPGYTYNTLDVKPTKTEKGHSFGQRLSLPAPVFDFRKKKINGVQLPLNHFPIFDSAEWVILRKLPSGGSLGSENRFHLCRSGKSAENHQQQANTGVNPPKKILYHLAPIGLEVGDIGNHALFVFFKDDILQDEGLTVHTDIERERIPSDSKFPV